MYPVFEAKTVLDSLKRRELSESSDGCKQDIDSHSTWDPIDIASMNRGYSLGGK